MWDEPEMTQIEEVPSESLPLDEALNRKFDNNVETKNKDGQKNKRQDSPKKKDKGSRKRKYSSSLDESDSDSDEDSSDDSDIDNCSSSESSKEDVSTISIPHQGSLSNLQRKRINGDLSKK